MVRPGGTIRWFETISDPAACLARRLTSSGSTSTAPPKSAVGSPCGRTRHRQIFPLSHSIHGSSGRTKTARSSDSPEQFRPTDHPTTTPVPVPGRERLPGTIDHGFHDRGSRHSPLPWRPRFPFHSPWNSRRAKNGNAPPGMVDPAGATGGAATTAGAEPFFAVHEHVGGPVTRQDRFSGGGRAELHPFVVVTGPHPGPVSRAEKPGRTGPLGPARGGRPTGDRTGSVSAAPGHVDVDAAGFAPCRPNLRGWRTTRGSP